VCSLTIRFPARQPFTISSTTASSVMEALLIVSACGVDHFKRVSGTRDPV